MKNAVWMGGSQPVTVAPVDLTAPAGPSSASGLREQPDVAAVVRSGVVVGGIASIGFGVPAVAAGAAGGETGLYSGFDVGLKVTEDLGRPTR